MYLLVTFRALAPRWNTSYARAIAVVLMATLLAAGLATDATAEAAPPTGSVREIVFPVVGSVRYSDTFGACRSGCSRSHAGEDLMAAKLTELVATRDATVRWLKGDATPDGTHGNYVILRDAEGWEYWYIHINNDSPGTDDGTNPARWRFGPGIERGAKVKAGQLVGYVGDSGNAEGTAPHLHFEIHRPDGSVINPNPSLGAALRLSAPLPPREQTTGDERFVHALSVDFLSRPADDVTVAGLLDAIRSGRSRDEIVARFATSDEWVSALITGYYRATLGRAPDAAGLRHWVDVIGEGATPAAVAADFYASDEYHRRSGGTNDGWVRALYSALLHRNPDSAGLAYWLGVLDAGASRASVAADFYGSIESRRTRVKGLYLALLGRSPDAGGHAYWAEILANGRDIDLATYLAASEEYHRRAIRRPIMEETDR